MSEPGGLMNQGPGEGRCSTSKRRLARIGHSIAATQTSPSPCAACGSPIEKCAPGRCTGMWKVVPAVRCRVSTLPAALVGRKRDERPLAVGARADRSAERHDRDLDAGHERRRGAAAQVERAHEAVGEVLGQEAVLGQDRAPAPISRLQREDLDGQRVAGLRTLHAHRPRQVVERVEVELALLEGRTLLHLAVAGHEQVEVHRVTGLDRQRRLELAIPGVVVDGRVEDVLGHAQVPS